MKCEECGKEKVKTKCSNCLGDGTEPFLIIFSKTCQACKGKGYYMMCPDFRAHRDAELAAILYRGHTPIRKPTLTGTRTCPNCKGRGKVTFTKPSPKTTPQYLERLQQGNVSTKTCPICNGRGTL